MRDYKKIQAWQLADHLAKSVYTATQKYPRSEQFGITSQLRRAAVSVACNIVEGSSRKGKKEYVQFLYTARASLAEAEYLIRISYDIGLLSQDTFNALHNSCARTARTLYGLIQAVESDKRTQYA